MLCALTTHQQWHIIGSNGEGFTDILNFSQFAKYLNMKNESVPTPRLAKTNLLIDTASCLSVNGVPKHCSNALLFLYNVILSAKNKTDLNLKRQYLS